jgi:AmpE protein
MKLIALILGLLLEHLASELLHLRELRWFDRYFDAFLARLARTNVVVRYALVVAALALPLAPVVWIAVRLLELPVPLGLPYLFFAVLIVFFCLGPRDLGNEIDTYCRAFESNDQEGLQKALTELLESRPSAVPDEMEAIEEAIFIQAAKRIFGVVFWFVVLGPSGAWVFRLSDLFRRRAAFERDRGTVGPQAAAAVETVHGLLIWLPARLVALSYALSGSFDHAFQAWRRYTPRPETPFYAANDELAARVGKAAMAGFLEQPADSAGAARNAMRLIERTLFIWVTMIALMTLFGWAI